MHLRHDAGGGHSIAPKTASANAASANAASANAASASQ